jgi:glyoxylase-like metal-dependent hydrolase (beta-lactamase superfamily II)
VEFALFEAHRLDMGRLRIERSNGKRILLPVGPCLLKTATRVILVDAGFDPGLEHRVEGVAWQKPEMDLADRLHELGLWFDDVSDIILTHLHDDHASGVLDRERDQALFPNARIHIQELALWKGLERVARGGERFVNEQLLDWLGESPNTVMHHGDWSLDDCIHVYHTGGHTPGHQIVLAGEAEFLRGEDGEFFSLDRQTDSGQSLLLAGDLLSLGACFLPGFRTSSDVDPERALPRRQELASMKGSLSYYLYHANKGNCFLGAA